MTTLAWITMISICSFVWGGFIFLLSRAWRREGEKQRGER